MTSSEMSTIEAFRRHFEQVFWRLEEHRQSLSHWPMVTFSIFLILVMLLSKQWLFSNNRVGLQKGTKTYRKVQFGRLLLHKLLQLID